jgi:hypothetical protein
MMTSSTKVLTRVSLCVWGSDLDSAVISASVGLTADSNQFSSECTSNDTAAVRFCSFSSHPHVPREDDFEKHATWLLDRLEPHRAVLDAWKKKGWCLRFYVTTVVAAHAGGPLVSARTLARIARLEVDTWWKTAASVPGHPGF